MTCEIVVANRLGLALAADSAVTFNGQNGYTYASGANKIFQLANAEPVAIMIYNGASLHTMPWEILIKAYRRQLGQRGFSTLIEYRDDFLRFLNDRNTPSISKEMRTLAARRIYGHCAGQLYGILESQEPSLFDPSLPPADHLAAYTRVSNNLDTALNNASIHPTLNANDLVRALASESDPLSVQIEAHIQEKASHLAAIVDARRLADQAVNAAFKLGEPLLSEGHTGLVIAGYGRDDYMPSFLSLHCYGLIGDRMLWSAQAQGDINHGITASLIQGFARQSMIETFTQGASLEVWQTVGQEFSRHAAEACRQAAAAANVVIPPHAIEQAVSDASTSFNKQWAYSTFESHLRPLRQVVAGLALEELAELAENLVMLESLKEKVTHRTQSVGGPVDLAVITKEEGLVWIKRKHYFDPKLNQRYMNRLQNH